MPQMRGQIPGEKKAPEDGRYIYNGSVFQAKAGKIMPPGAVFLREGDPVPKLNPGGDRRFRRRATEVAPGEALDAPAARSGRRGGRAEVEPIDPNAAPPEPGS